MIITTTSINPQGNYELCYANNCDYETFQNRCEIAVNSRRKTAGIFTLATNENAFRIVAKIASKMLSQIAWVNVYFVVQLSEALTCKQRLTLTYSFGFNSRRC